MDNACAYSMEGGVDGVIWSEVGKEVSSVVCMIITLLAISLTRLHRFSLLLNTSFSPSIRSRCSYERPRRGRE